LSHGHFPAKRLVENYLRRVLDLGEDTGVSVDGIEPGFIACVEGLSGKQLVISVLVLSNVSQTIFRLL
jgi:hypothetical protein